MVELWVIVGRDGNVHQARVARAAGGEMDAAALNAVRQWKFQPSIKDGQPVQSQINLQVAFNGAMASTSTTTNAGYGKPPRLIELKLHPQLVAVYNCWQAQADKSQAQRVCKLRTDKLRINVIVSGDAETALKRLKAIGFKPEQKPAHVHQIAGRISVDKLDALAAIAPVVFVAPEPATIGDVGAVKKR